MFQNFKLVFNKIRFYSLNANSEDAINFLLKLNLLEKHNFINGERISGLGSSQNNFNPATGKVLTKINSSSTEQVDKCISSAIIAQQKWNKIPNKDKSKILLKAADLILSKAKIIATVDVLDTGKAFWEAQCDINDCAYSLQMFASFIHSHEGSFVSLNDNNFYYTKREPLGVCVGIGAWNFPFQMMTWKSAPALATGNSFIFKPSPLTPLSAILLAEIYHEAGIPTGLVSVVQGGADIGRYLSCHRDVAKISFTGSVPTGRKIMKDVSDTVKHLTLELGGKSPLIIFEDADLTESIKGVILANFLTQGEVCSNGTRVFIQKDIYPEFKTRLVEAIKTLKIGDPFDSSVAIGAIISDDQYNVVMGYINSAKQEHGEILYGGTRAIFPEESYLFSGKYIVPCVIGNCTDNMKVVQEEIFGPVVSLLTFNLENEAIERANKSIYGLAGGLFTTNINRAHRVAAQLQCGCVYINTYNAYPPGMPFGGYKQSGFGRENCRQTMDNYSQLKAIFVESNPIDYPFWPRKS